DYDVGQLQDHVLGWLTNFADGFADPGGQAPRAEVSGYQAPADAAAEVRSAAARLDRALRGGAAQRPLRLGGAAPPRAPAPGSRRGDRTALEPAARGVAAVAALRADHAHRGLPGRGQGVRRARRGSRYRAAAGPAARAVRPRSRLVAGLTVPRPGA